MFVVSLETDALWRDKTLQLLREFQVLDYVNLIEAPLAEEPNAAKKLCFQFPTAADALLVGHPIDLVLIDGPPGGIGRQDTLPSFVHRIAPGADVLLDDSYRPAEASMLLDWQEKYGAADFPPRVLPLGKGLGWIRRR